MGPLLIYLGVSCILYCPCVYASSLARLSSSDRNGSRTYVDVELLVVHSSDGLLGASEIAGARILLMADSYLQRGNLNLSCLCAMAQAACFAYNATPISTSFTYCSTAELWYLQRLELSSLVGVPGTLVRFQTESEHQAEDYGLYCLPGIQHQHFVYGVHSQSLCEATSVDLAISAHTSDLLRSQVGPSMFHYPSCPPGASSSLGEVVWVRGQLGLVVHAWHRDRVKASRLITALELELRPDSDLKML